MRKYIKQICGGFLLIGEVGIFIMSTPYAENQWNGKSQMGGFLMFFVSQSIILVCLLLMVLLLSEIAESITRNEGLLKNLTETINDNARQLVYKYDEAKVEKDDARIKNNDYKIPDNITRQNDRTESTNKTNAYVSWVCSNCNTNNAAEARFCKSCGKHK